MSSPSSSPHKRLQSTTRLDVISLMTGSPPERGRKPKIDSPQKRSTSHRDSLSPLRESRSAHGDSPHRATETRKPLLRGAVSEASPQRSFLRTTPSHAVATLPRKTAQRAFPRSPDDFTFNLHHVRSAVSTPDLSKFTADGYTSTCSTRTRVPQPPPHRHIARLPIAMGNKPSSIAGSPTPDDQSAHSVVRKPVNPVRFLRKGSANLIMRIDSRSPLTEPTTPKVTILRDPASSSDFGETDHGDGHISDFNQPPNHARTPPIIVPPRKHSTSTVIVTDDDETQPLSASTTIKGRKSCSRNESRAAQNGRQSDMDDHNTLTALRSSALSPTIPAPSPLPEDSPHKYGLLDRMDTPEAQPPPEDINAVKARRRSNGVEIFKVSACAYAPNSTSFTVTDTDEQEAKTLQSAASFLNGLSTSRRRAESASRTTESYAYVSRPNSRRGSQVGANRPSTIRQTNSTVQLSSGDFEGRRKGHNFKANGFAYSRPLGITQLKCYRTHARLVISKNKVAPVECAVCHMDDDHEHYSCSWCAIRMCRYCRKEFSERGISALRERIKQAEMPADDISPSSSIRSLTRGRSTLF